MLLASAQLAAQTIQPFLVSKRFWQQSSQRLIASEFQVNIYLMLATKGIDIDFKKVG
jgi:hypothetical protein